MWIHDSVVFGLVAMSLLTGGLIGGFYAYRAGQRNIIEFVQQSLTEYAVALRLEASCAHGWPDRMRQYVANIADEILTGVDSAEWRDEEGDQHVH